MGRVCVTERSKQWLFPGQPVNRGYRRRGVGFFNRAPKTALHEIEEKAKSQLDASMAVPQKNFSFLKKRWREKKNEKGASKRRQCARWAHSGKRVPGNLQ